MFACIKPTLTKPTISSISSISRRTLVTADALSLDIPPVELAYEKFDPPKSKPTGEPIVFLHGIFGSKQNNKTVSKVLARDLSRTVYCLDLRNHGDSPHNSRHDYPALAADVEHFLNQNKLSRSILIGHSMGAKTAMAVALRQPNLVHSLLPVDNAPVDAKLGSDFNKYVKGMKVIDQMGVKQTKEAYKVMENYEKSLPIQQFLLANLKKNDNGIYKFRVPLDTLGKSLDYMADFPYHPDTSRYERPTLFIRGTDSTYVADECFPAMGQFFPRFQCKDVEAGHWLISENPQPFLEYTKEFITQYEE